MARASSDSEDVAGTTVEERRFQRRVKGISESGALAPEGLADAEEAAHRP